jgi:hypothetical protein
VGLFAHDGRRIPAAMKFGGALALSVALELGAAMGGEEVVSADLPTPETGRWAGNWCQPLKNSLGMKAAGKEPWLWDMKMFGRLQYQYAYVDGQDRSGRDFNYDTSEVRRFYLGGQARFLKSFQVVGRAVFENDCSPLGGEREWGYEELWDLGVKADVKKMFGIAGVDALTVGYGKKQLNVSDEWHTSSNCIKTVERSSIANYVWPRTSGWSNPTGAWVDVRRGAWEGAVGVFSTDHSKEFSEWDDGLLYYGEVVRSIDSSSWWIPERVNLAGFWQDADTGDEKLAGGIEWAASLAGGWKAGPWDIRGNVIVGDNGDQSADRDGVFWGVTVMPSIEIVPEKLDFVTRYQYQGAEETEGIRMWSRYARRAEAMDPGIDINGGRGDAHHNFYAGLIYHVCGNNLKLMAGVEYDDISSGGEDVYEGWTGSLAVRSYF